MENNFTNNEELLVRLLDGELDAVEKQSVEQQLAADKELQEQYDSLLLAKESLKQYGLKQKVATIHQQMMEEMQAPVRKINPVKRLVRLSTAIAAGVILLIGGFWLYNNSQTVSGDKVFASNYHTYDMGTMRSSDTETGLEKAYKAKNYAEVVRLSDATEAKSTESSFLAGAAALELNDVNKAVKKFTETLQLNNAFGITSYKDDAEYYLALSYIKATNYSPALDLLQKIKNEPAHKYYGQVSDKLMSQVKRLTKK